MYPDLDPEISRYHAGIVYTDGAIRLDFPGSHDSFADAKARASRLCAALIAAGEMGIRPRVGYSGERPADFPRNGVVV